MTMLRKSIIAKDITFAVAIISVAMLVVFASLPNTTIFMHVLHKTGHPLAFGTIALLARALLSRHATIRGNNPWTIYLAALAFAGAIGAATEVGQLFTHRDARFADVISDAIGATACLAGHVAAFGHVRFGWPVAVRIGAAGVAVTAAGFSLAPLAWCLAAYAERDMTFPIILENRSRLATYFVSVRSELTSTGPTAAEGADGWSGYSSDGIEVNLGKGKYPGLSIKEPFPRWQGFQTLAIDIENLGMDELPIVVRVHDRIHSNEFEDRFNREVTLPSNTRSTLLISVNDIQQSPKRRLLDLESIAGMGIFALGPLPGKAFRVRRIWLTK